jgi:hypothetical protein
MISKHRAQGTACCCTWLPPNAVHSTPQAAAASVAQSASFWLELGWGVRTLLIQGRMRRWVIVDDWEWHGCWCAACSADSMAGLNIHVGVKADYRSSVQAHNTGHSGTRGMAAQSRRKYTPSTSVLKSGLLAFAMKHVAAAHDQQAQGAVHRPKERHASWPTLLHTAAAQRHSPIPQTQWPSCSKGGPVHTPLAGRWAGLGAHTCPLLIRAECTDG